MHSLTPFYNETKLDSILHAANCIFLYHSAVIKVSLISAILFLCKKNCTMQGTPIYPSFITFNNINWHANVCKNRYIIIFYVITSWGYFNILHLQYKRKINKYIFIYIFSYIENATKNCNLLKKRMDTEFA